MSSPNDPVLCCPLPYRVAPVFVQVVSPPLGWSPLTSFLVIWSPSSDARGPDYLKNMFLTHEHTNRLQRIRWAPQHFNKMETNLPNNNNYEIKVKHTNSKYCRFCIRHEIPKLIKDNYLPGKVLEKINNHSYSGFVHYAQNYIVSEYESMCCTCIRNCYICND